IVGVIDDSRRIRVLEIDAEGEAMGAAVEGALIGPIAQHLGHANVSSSINLLVKARPPFHSYPRRTEPIWRRTASPELRNAGAAGLGGSGPRRCGSGPGG